MARLSAFFIDCADDVFEDGLAFWAAAFGVEPIRGDDPDNPYVELPGVIPGVAVELQRIGSPSRFHLDVEAEDVDAEAQRMVDLGAERVGKIESWWVLRAPTGHLFCVVPTDH